MNCLRVPPDPRAETRKIGDGKPFALFHVAMKPSYPVTFDVTRPERYDRSQLAVRLIGTVALSIFGITFPRLFSGLYLVLPILAAVFISTQGPEGYLRGKGARVTRWLHWIMA